MPALGLDVPKETIDELFSEWDKDGGGELGYGELRKILSTSGRNSNPNQPAAAKKSAAGTSGKK
jgi:Ca2+-binding EF-hand superfamily protein